MEKLLSNILSKFTEHNIENIVLKGLPLDKNFTAITVKEFMVI